MAYRRSKMLSQAAPIGPAFCIDPIASNPGILDAGIDNQASPTT
jgi:hypothetical protein